MLIAIKDGVKTIYRTVKDNELAKQNDPSAGRDLTTGGAKLISMGLSEEKYNKIFCKNIAKN